MAPLPPRFLSLLLLGTAGLAVAAALIVGLSSGRRAARPGDGEVQGYRVLLAPFAAGSIHGQVVFGSAARASLTGAVPAGCASSDPVAVVSVSGAVSGVAPSTGPVVLSLGGCGFEPKVLAAEEGGVLRVSAGPDHRVEAWEGGVRVFDAAAGGNAAFVLHSSGIWKVRCAAGHSGEEAWIYVTSHPYAVPTGRDGRFSLVNVPVGHYQLTVWDPPDLETTRPVEVVADMATDVVLSF